MVIVESGLTLRALFFVYFAHSHVISLVRLQVKLVINGADGVRLRTQQRWHIGGNSFAARRDLVERTLMRFLSPGADLTSLGKELEAYVQQDVFTEICRRNIVAARAALQAYADVIGCAYDGGPLPSSSSAALPSSAQVQAAVDHAAAVFAAMRGKSAGSGGHQPPSSSSSSAGIGGHRGAAVMADGQLVYQAKGPQHSYGNHTSSYGASSSLSSSSLSAAPFLRGPGSATLVSPGDPAVRPTDPEASGLLLARAAGPATVVKEVEAFGDDQPSSTRSSEGAGSAGGGPLFDAYTGQPAYSVGTLSSGDGAPYFSSSSSSAQHQQQKAAGNSSTAGGLYSGSQAREGDRAEQSSASVAALAAAGSSNNGPA